MQAMTETPRPKWRKLAMNMLGGAVVGAAGAAALLSTAGAGVLGALTVSQEIALLVALMYLLMGFAVGIGVVSPRLGSKFLNVEDADELSEERGLLASSALGCIALALGLGAVALAGGDAAAGAVVAPAVALGLFLVTLAAATWLSFRSMHHADELMRATIRDGAVASYYLAFAAIGGWALVAHLGFAAAPGMLDIVTLFYGLTLAGCFWVVGRRGMLLR